MNNDGSLPSRARWFDPTNTRLKGVAGTPDGDPYIIFNDYTAGRPTTLIIPTFSDSTSGVYTCGTGLRYPPGGNVAINLMLTASKGYFYYDC